ncbi:beta-D-glucosyl crocetin beta-1,6-glucosyltransferase-like [Impatiens glandulifera]|uniref:beta-D-glucosyl crocetin beta-1,6-glucosyltransferase-like n=1 Tax=Impatiens glandulifera TaxID=253017 RepID=UPI001FB0B542|nr:beta-D-glucosyl crocetin beta-1,6-glucosyltransferase-like [Impatiens glandulifera]
MESKGSILNIVMFPWLAHGHVSPFLELAKRLEKRNLTIHLCSTEVILNSIKKKISENDYPFLHFIEIKLPFNPELPPHHHTTSGLPPHLNYTLMRALDMASPYFSTILKQVKPDLVIYDIHQPWAPEVAASLSIPAVMFHTTSLSILYYGFHMNLKQGVEFPYPELNPQGSYFTKKVQKMFETLPAEDNFEERTPSHFSYLRSSEIVLTKTFREVEEGYVDYTSSLLGKKVIITGPLVTNPVEDDIIVETDSTVKLVIKWLDMKEKASTVLVSFGSECYLSREEREEMAYGLEQSNVNFIWVIRFPMNEKIISIEESIPEGFLKRVGERGLVIDKWVPQVKILTHTSIGGFISHCGWGSLTEAMGFGVPIIAVPVQYDQPINAKVIVKAGAGAEIYRDEEGGLNRLEIARVIKEVVLEDAGKEIRKKAREMKEKLVIEGDDQEIDVVVKELVRICSKHNSS